MAATDVLKNLRSSDYGSKKENKNDRDDEGMDSQEEVKTPRIISLTDDEQQAFSKAKPGEDLACEVHGSLESDGHFHVMSVQPLGGASGYPGEEDQMATQVAQKVQPNIAPSPS